VKIHVVVHSPWYVTLVRLVIAVVLVGGLFATCARTAHAETFKPGGLLLSTDCDEYACSSYQIQVSKKFVRLPIKKQVELTRKLCTKLDDGVESGVQSCIFQYRGEDIMWLATTGLVEVEPTYVMALAALRD